MHIILSALLFFLALSPFSLTAVTTTTNNLTETEMEDPKSPSIPPRESPTNNDHGFMFPLEDLVDTPEKHNERFYSEFLSMLATLGLVIGIILIAAWFLRRLLNTRLEQINTTSIIKIIERRTLSPKSAVYLLEIYDKVIAVAETQNGLTQLGEFNLPPAEAENLREKSSSFSKILEKK